MPQKEVIVSGTVVGTVVEDPFIEPKEERFNPQTVLETGQEIWDNFGRETQHLFTGLAGFTYLYFFKTDLSLPIQAVLGLSSLANLIKGGHYLTKILAGYKEFGKQKALQEQRTSQVDLQEALNLLTQPLSLELADEMRNRLGNSGLYLPVGNLFADRLLGDGTCLLAEETGLLAEEPELLGLNDRFSALQRVSQELTDFFNRGKVGSDVFRSKVLRMLGVLLKGKNDLSAFPGAEILLKQAIASILIEDSPPVLAEMIKIIECLLAHHFKKEPFSRSFINTLYLNTAIRMGVSIPAGARKERDRDRVKIELSSQGLKDLVWALGAIQLKSTPELSSGVEKIIFRLRGWLAKKPDEKVLKILDFVEKIPQLDLGISVYQLARNLNLEGASIEQLSAEDLGLSVNRSVTLVTLPPKRKIPLSTWAQILTRTAIASPLSPYIALAKGILKSYSLIGISYRLENLTERDIEMLFERKEALDWLLEGRDPEALLSMNLVRKTDEGVRGNLAILPAVV